MCNETSIYRSSQQMRIAGLTVQQFSMALTTVRGIQDMHQLPYNIGRYTQCCAMTATAAMLVGMNTRRMRCWETSCDRQTVPELYYARGACFTVCLCILVASKHAHTHIHTHAQQGVPWFVIAQMFCVCTLPDGLCLCTGWAVS